jgi:hypothetical protein
MRLFCGAFGTGMTPIRGSWCYCRPVSACSRMMALLRQQLYTGTSGARWNRHSSRGSNLLSTIRRRYLLRWSRYDRNLPTATRARRLHTAPSVCHSLHSRRPLRSPTRCLVHPLCEADPWHACPNPNYHSGPRGMPPFRIIPS